MAKRVVTAYAVLVLIINGSLMVAHYEVSTSVWHSVVYLLDITIYLSPFVMCPITICSVDTWKDAGMKHVPFFRKLRKSSEVADIYKKTNKEAASFETELYFTELNKAWI